MTREEFETSEVKDLGRVGQSYVGKTLKELEQRLASINAHQNEVAMGRAFSKEALQFVRDKEGKRVKNLTDQEVTEFYANKCLYERSVLEPYIRELYANRMQFDFSDAVFFPRIRNLIRSTLLTTKFGQSESKAFFQNKQTVFTREQVTALVALSDRIAVEGTLVFENMMEAAASLEKLGFDHKTARAIIDQLNRNQQDVDGPRCCSRTCSGCPLNFPLSWKNTRRENGEAGVEAPVRPRWINPKVADLTPFSPADLLEYQTP